MPVSSLPSPYGIGCFSKEAYSFVDRLREAGQTYWQLLPLGPTGYGDSPYQSFSAFAGNPYYIDLESLCREGVLTEKECKDADLGADETAVDYARQYHERNRLLRLASSRMDLKNDASYRAFCEEQKDWLDDYCLFMAVKHYFQEKGWTEWEMPIRLRRENAVSEFRELCREETDYHRWLQYLFMKQWTELKKYANSAGIRIIGDIPIYVAFDSSDTWASPDLFLLDEEGIPPRVAGVPPDAFAAGGQLWGNPLYDWSYHEKTGYAWWKRRLERCFELYDVVRVDHFRGFDEYYAVPYGDPDASRGSWEKGPGLQLFAALKEHFGRVPIIAEDLGYVTESVQKLVADTGYPSMKLIEFAFDSRENGDYMPYTYSSNCVVYTGTHDNQTLYAWYDELTGPDRRKLNDYLELDGCSREEIVWRIIRLTLATVADTAIIPMQDYLCLGAQARMNRPSTLGNNWKWRMKKDAFDASLAEKIRKLTVLYGRIR